MNRRGWCAVAAVVLSLACGEPPPDESAPAAGPAPAATNPVAADWVRADSSGVTIDLVAGREETNGRWNFAGFANGTATVVVPTGARVTVRFSNEDAQAAHSVAIVPVPADGWSVVPDAQPVFAGAASPDPAGAATPAGETAELTFDAATPGEYAIACLVPGHAAAGMWIGFRVADGANPAVMSAP